jgi:hypothetical protein
VLPAYARQIVEARQRGDHPRAVSVLYSTSWFREAVLPVQVQVLAAEFAARRYEFWWCAGVPVIVCNFNGDPFAFSALVVELARVTAPVFVIDLEVDDEALFADSYLWALRLRQGDGQWPAGWTAEDTAAFDARCERYAASARFEPLQKLLQRGAS